MPGRGAVVHAAGAGGAERSSQRRRVGQWEYRRCANDQFAVITKGDLTECEARSSGGDCTASSSTDVVSEGGLLASSCGRARFGGSCRCCACS
jgi:hypothetical protein